MTDRAKHLLHGTALSKVADALGLSRIIQNGLTLETNSLEDLGFDGNDLVLTLDWEGHCFTVGRCSPRARHRTMLGR